MYPNVSSSCQEVRLRRQITAMLSKAHLQEAVLRLGASANREAASGPGFPRLAGALIADPLTPKLRYKQARRQMAGTAPFNGIEPQSPSSGDTVMLIAHCFCST